MIQGYRGQRPCPARDRCREYACEDLTFEAWERMTYGGVIARYCDIVPYNFYTEIDGQQVSRPRRHHDHD